MATYEDFLEQSKAALQRADLPEELWRTVYDKSSNDIVYDGGNHFILVPNENPDERKGAHTLHASCSIQKNQDVYFVDQFWTNDGGYKAKKQLLEMPLLRERLMDMFGIASASKHTALEIQQGQSTVVQEMYDVDSFKADNLLAEHHGCLLDVLLLLDSPEYSGRDQNTQREVLSNTDTCSFEEFKCALINNLGSSVVEEYPEGYVEKLYKQFLQDSKTKEGGSGVTDKYSWTDNITDGFIYVSVPLAVNVKKAQVSSVLTSKTWKLKVDSKEILSGTFSGKIITDESFWSFESPGLLSMALQKQGDEHLLWNELFEGEKQLSLEDVLTKNWVESNNSQVAVKKILDKMWLFNRTRPSYSAARRIYIPLWYVPDEVGTGILHSQTPNVVSTSVFLGNHGLSYDIILPIRDIQEDEPINRNCFTSSSEREPESNVLSRMKTYLNGIDFHSTSKTKDESEKEPPSSDEKLPDLNLFNFDDIQLAIKFPKARIYSNIYSESFNKRLSQLDNVAMATSDDDIDIFLVCVGTQLYNLKANQYVNCFYDQKLFNLASVFQSVKNELGNVPWLPEVYNLESEFSKFCASYRKIGYGQLWLVKSALSDGMHFDPVITSHALRITRLVETGQVVAMKYIPNTMLYNGRKFALSYTVLVLSSAPQRIFLYDRPYVRLAERKYNGSEIFDEYDNSAMKSIRGCEVMGCQDTTTFQDFVTSFNSVVSKAQGEIKWTDCDMKIRNAIANFISSATRDIKIDTSASVFGLYGVDFIIDSGQQPVLVDFDLFPTFADDKALSDVLRLLFDKGIEEKTASMLFSEIKRKE